MTMHGRRIRGGRFHDLSLDLTVVAAIPVGAARPSDVNQSGNLRESDEPANDKHPLAVNALLSKFANRAVREDVFPEAISKSHLPRLSSRDAIL